MRRCFGKTISGRPGRDRTCRRNRYPARCKNRRTISSGTVSCDLMRLITYERFCGVKTSAIRLAPPAAYVSYSLADDFGTSHLVLPQRGHSRGLADFPYHSFPQRRHFSLGPVVRAEEYTRAP